MRARIIQCRVLSSVLCVLVAALGCGKGESQSEPAEQSARVNQPAQTRQPSTRGSGIVWRSLLDEVGRAELDVGGPSGGVLIDFGTADQHKYTRGGWRTGFGESRRVDGVTLSQVRGDRAVLDTVVDDEIRELVVRARAVRPGLVVTAYIGATRIGELTLDSAWQVGRIPVATGVLAAGRRKLVFRFAEPGPSGKPDEQPNEQTNEQATGEPDESASARPLAHVADFDWLWLARAAGSRSPAPSTRVAPVRMAGQPKRALVAPTTRTLGFYLQPHADTRLVFDYGSRRGATFTVRASTDTPASADGKPAAAPAGQSNKELFSAAGTDSWQEASVPLGAYAGRALRLQLSVTVPEQPDPDTGDATDASAHTGWGEPVIMRATSAERPRKKLAKRPRNVILLVLDTARADVYGPFARGEPVHTPNFDALAERSAVFASAYNNENWTKPSVATTLSGLYPSTHDTKRDGSVLPDGVTLLPQHLQKHGFRTAGFVANGYISEYFGFEKGWDQFVNHIRHRVPSEAERVFRDARDFVRTHAEQRPEQPFFLYIQTIDPHVVYDVPRKYSQRYFDGKYRGYLGDTIDASDQVRLARRSRDRKPGSSDRHRAWLRALYFGEVTYHDEHLGHFLRYLDDSGTLEDTLLVVTNDHGEELGERGFYGHGHSLYDEMIRAPLLMHYPAIFTPGTRIPDIVENVDVAPTILDILDQPPLPDAEGRSLVPMITGGPMDRPGYAISEFLDGRRAIRIGRYSFMRSVGTWIHLFDLEADPGQTEDIIATHPIARRMCEVYLGEGLATPDKRKRQQDLVSRRRLVAGKAEVSPGVRRQLSALGYFGDSEDRSEDDAKD